MPFPRTSSPIIFGLFLLTIFLGVMTAGSSWELNHGGILLGAGLVMLFFRPAGELPRFWSLLALGFALLALTPFLPLAWFGTPEWRQGLDALGLDLGDRQVIQARMALEEWAVLVATLLIGLGLARQRLESPRGPALAFALGVAAYALLSRMSFDPGETFGFFPNRNHTATLLSLGSVVGLGCTVQALREKQWPALGLSVAAVGICLFAVLGWSMSRAGLLLVGVGSLSWFACLGKGYLGRHAVKLVALTALAGVGGFLVTENPIKERLEDNVEMINSVLEPSSELREGAASSIDFRIPTWLDSCGMIAESPWVGVGPGQFRYVFPQDRQRTAVMGETRSIHPESDWLWMAAEIGIPGTLLLAALVVSALGFSLRRALKGRVRAIRVACLVGAGLVAFHGCFDVPGHRLSLALAAAWLFGLSLAPSRREDERADRPVSRGSVIQARLLGLLPLGLGLCLLLAAWGSLPAPAVSASRRAQVKAIRLYQEDQKLMAESLERGEEAYEPEDDLLAEAIDGLSEAAQWAPLDPSLWRLRGTLALQFDDRQAEVDRSFAIERALLPGVVEVPLKQASAWGEYGPQRVRDLWSEALDRAESLDRAAGEAGKKREWTQRSIRQSARNSELLGGIAEDLVVAPEAP